MGKIIVLDENTSNKIAAGEVIEKPASVIKELVENSIDAGATSITVEIKNGGILYIRVSDNGSGIDEDDAELAFERHATSKIKNSDDLDSIATLGFRGEALASIASVSTTELTTRTKNNPHGVFVKIQGGKIKDIKQIGCPIGTTFVITDLFYNTPARFKFLKKDSTEAGYISDIICRIALSHPWISFKLISNSAIVIHTPGNNDLQSTIFSIYGRETSKGIEEINYEENSLKINGFAGKPEIARASRIYQSIFINGRYIKSKLITAAIDESYKTFLMKGKFPFIVLNINLNPGLIDVNVHPTKMEIRFSSEQEIFRSIYHAISNALLNKSQIKSVGINPEKALFTFEPKAKKEYIQKSIEFGAPLIKETSEKSEDKSIYNNNTNNAGTILTKSKITTDETKLENNEYEEIKIEISSGKELISNEKTIDIKKEIPNSIIKELREEESKEELKEELLNSEFVSALFNNYKIIGQVFSTYILIQQENELILIDQHAAHERIMFESIKVKYQMEEQLSQSLLSPLVIELTNQEIKLLEENNQFFKRLGFINENFGNNSIILRAIPYFDSDRSAKETFLKVIDHVLNFSKNDYKRLEDEAIYTIACKAAVKAHKRLNDSEIEAILNQLAKIRNPFTCPHGRPTIIKITKYELEKMFKRIV